MAQKNTQEQAFSTLITLLLCLHENSKQNNDKFPEELLNNVVMKLLDDDRTTNNLVLKYEDFKDNLTLNYYTLKSVLSLLKEKRKTGASFVFQENVFTLLQLFCTILDESDGKVDNIKKKFSAVWVEFLKLKLSPILYKKILINLHTKILPNLTNPLLLTDFLTDSYNIGGVISLLALNGLFFLIQKYNLEYPDFYTKLYALLTDFIFFVKYRARFFYLTDLFLSSTHIPAYLVAAFAKRLARLSLIAPPDVLITLIPFIGNLLIRHPSLLVLVDRNSENVNEDPFIADETDPSLCNAIDSSLWEIKSLQNHWHPDVSKKAIFVNKQLPKMDWDLADVLEIRYKDLFENEIERLKDLGEEDEIPLSYHQAKGVFIRKEDEMNSLWTL